MFDFMKELNIFLYWFMLFMVYCFLGLWIIGLNMGVVFILYEYLMIWFLIFVGLWLNKIVFFIIVKFVFWGMINCFLGKFVLMVCCIIGFLEKFLINRNWFMFFIFGCCKMIFMYLIIWFVMDVKSCFVKLVLKWSLFVVREMCL